MSGLTKHKWIFSSWRYVRELGLQVRTLLHWSDSVVHIWKRKWWWRRRVWHLPRPSGLNVLLNPISLLHNEAVRKRKESSFLHLYANPEASGARLGPISGCKEAPTPTRPTWLAAFAATPRLPASLGSSLEVCPHDWKEQNNRWDPKGLRYCLLTRDSFNLSSPIQSETPRKRGGQKAQGRLMSHLKCKNPGPQTVQSPGCQRCT